MTRTRLPEWLKRGIVDCDKTRYVRKLLKQNKLCTVCESARCPNKGECYSKNTATFMILGNTCTRTCNFCAVQYSDNPQYSDSEAENIANVVKKLGLKYVVITSVTRDDLPDGGAAHFVNVVRQIRLLDANVAIEVLVPDFLGNKNSIQMVVESGINVFNHNIETVKHLYQKARPQADYLRTLEVLKYAKECSQEVITKSGFMVGLGETLDDIEVLLKDLKNAGCDFVTVGQYIQPAKSCLVVEKYYTPEEFDQITQMAQELNLKKVVSGPLVRSSYKAFELFQSIN